MHKHKRSHTEVKLESAKMILLEPAEFEGCQSRTIGCKLKEEFIAFIGF